MSFDQIGKLLIFVGIAVVVVGVIMLLLGRTPFSNLPGNITFSTGNFTCVIPLVSMLLISILLTIILNIVLRLFNR
jgi:hypothetical protein